MTLISIFVRNLKEQCGTTESNNNSSSNNKEIIVDPEQLVRALRYTISKRFDIPDGQYFGLIYQGKMLDEPQNRLSHYNIQSNAQIEIVYSLEGGFGLFRRRHRESFLARIINFIKKYALVIIAGLIFAFVMVSGMIPFVSNFFFDRIHDSIYLHTLIPLDAYMDSVDSIIYYLFLTVIYYVILIFEFMLMMFIKVWVNQFIVYSMASCVFFLLVYTMTKQHCYSMAKATEHGKTVARIFIFIFLFQMIPFFGNWIRTQPSPEGPIFDELLFGLTNPGWAIGEAIESVGLSFNDFSQMVCGMAGFNVSKEHLLSLGGISEDVEDPADMLDEVFASGLSRFLSKYIKPLPLPVWENMVGSILGRIAYSVQWILSLIICTIFGIFQQYGARDWTGYFNLQKTLDRMKDASFAGIIGLIAFGILSIWLMFSIWREEKRERRRHESTFDKVANVGLDVVDPFRLI